MAFLAAFVADRLTFDQWTLGDLVSLLLAFFELADLFVSKWVFLPSAARPFDLRLMHSWRFGIPLDGSLRIYIAFCFEPVFLPPAARPFDLRLMDSWRFVSLLMAVFEFIELFISEWASVPPVARLFDL